MNISLKNIKIFFRFAILKYNYFVTIKTTIMNYPRFYKTEKGEVINLSMITQMYKRNDDICIIELVGGSGCTVTEEEMERIYRVFRVSVN